MRPTTTEFYIVRVLLKEVKGFDGSVLTKAGAESVLGMDDGYPAIGGSPHRFDQPPARAEIAKWDGMPWYKVIDTAHVIKVTERRLFERAEVDLGEVA